MLQPALRRAGWTCCRSGRLHSSRLYLLGGKEEWNSDLLSDLDPDMGGDVDMAVGGEKNVIRTSREPASSAARPN